MSQTISLSMWAAEYFWQAFTTLSKGYRIEFEKDKFSGLDPSALMLLSRHFRTHPLHNYLVSGLYGFSSRPFSSRMHFFCRSMLNCFGTVSIPPCYTITCALYLQISFGCVFMTVVVALGQAAKFTLTCFSSFVWCWIFFSLLALLCFTLAFNMVFRPQFVKISIKHRYPR